MDERRNKIETLVSGEPEAKKGSKGDKKDGKGKKNNWRERKSCIHLIFTWIFFLLIKITLSFHYCDNICIWTSRAVILNFRCDSM